MIVFIIDNIKSNLYKNILKLISKKENKQEKIKLDLIFKIKKIFSF